MTDYNYVVKLGNTNTIIVKSGDGVILIEPSVVAVDTENNNQVVAVGSNAIKSAKNSNNIELLYPIADGVVKNKQYATTMLRMFLKQVEFKTLFTKNNVVVLIPTSLSAQEKNDYVNIAYSCMFTQVTLLPTVYAGMVNMEIEEYDARHHLLCKLGGGVTDVALMSAGSIVNACTIDLGGNTLNNAINQYICDSYHVEVPSEMAEEIKIELSTLLPNDNRSYSIYGQNNLDGNYGNVVVTSSELRPIFIDYFTRVAGIISGLLGSCDTVAISDINKRGVYLFGALGSITGLDRFLSSKLNVPVYIDVEPESTVINGATALLNNPNLLQSVIGKYNN